MRHLDLSQVDVCLGHEFGISNGSVYGRQELDFVVAAIDVRLFLHAMRFRHVIDDIK